jgi:hypothetical protein
MDLAGYFSNKNAILDQWGGVFFHHPGNSIFHNFSQLLSPLPVVSEMMYVGLINNSIAGA